MLMLSVNRRGFMDKLFKMITCPAEGGVPRTESIL